MTEVIVHGVPGSPYVRSVLLALEEKFAPYRLAAMDMGEGKTPKHLVRHPFGCIPVINLGNFQLYETQSILRYVDAVFPGAPLRPVDPRAAARADQLCGIVDCYLFPQVSATVGFQRVVGPLMGLTPDEAVIAAAMPKARVVISVLSAMLGEQSFMAGEALSIADLMAAPQLDFLAITPEGADLLGGTPLEGWLDRMRERLSMAATTPQRLGMAA